MRNNVHTPAELRDILFEELEKFRSKKSTPKHAQIVVNFARSIIDSARLDLIALHLGENGGKLIARR